MKASVLNTTLLTIYAFEDCHFNIDTFEEDCHFTAAIFKDGWTQTILEVPGIPLGALNTYFSNDCFYLS